MRAPCKLCYLKKGNMRPQIELIEKILLNQGYKGKPTKPLSYTQICYICYIIFGISIERHTLQKHYINCMGNKDKKCPVYYDPRQGAFIDQSGKIVSKEEFIKYRRSRFHDYSQ